MNDIKLRASAANLWSNCPGSLRVKQFVPEKVSFAALEGDVIHRLTKGFFTNTLTDDSTFEMMLNYIHPIVDGSDFILTDEHIELAKGASMFCKSLSGVSGQMERAFDLEIAGTTQKVRPDCVKIYTTGRILHIVDFKFGRRYVPAVGNMQLLCYAVAAMQLPEMEKYQFKEIRLHIYQPRIYEDPRRVWILTRQNYDIWAADLESDAKTALSGIDECFVTGRHCWNCFGKTHCQAFVRLVRKFDNIAFTEIDPEEVPTSVIGEIYGFFKDMQKTLNLAVDAFESRIMHEINCGGKIPGWMIETGKGKDKVVGDISQLKMLEALTGEKLTEEKPISITAIKRKKSLKPFLPQIISKSSGKPKLVKFNQDKIKETFKND